MSLAWPVNENGTPGAGVAASHVTVVHAVGEVGVEVGDVAPALDAVGDGDRLEQLLEVHLARPPALAGPDRLGRRHRRHASEPQRVTPRDARRSAGAIRPAVGPQPRPRARVADSDVIAGRYHGRARDLVDDGVVLRLVGRRQHDERGSARRAAPCRQISLAMNSSLRRG